MMRIGSGGRATRWCTGGAILALGLAMLPGFGPSAVGAQAEDPVVMIVGSAAGLPNITDIPSDVLRAAFLGLATTYDGVRLVPFNAPVGQRTRARVDRYLLGINPRDVGNFWVNQRVRDGRTPPATVLNLKLAVRVVAKIRGAIAYLPNAKVGPQVRILSIDGKRPSDPGYLLGTR